MKQLNEKVAIVTGAGQGIGKELLFVLQKEGLRLLQRDVEQSQLSRQLQRLRN